jgi:hypothetical protein
LLLPSALHYDPRPLQFLLLPLTGCALMGAGFSSNRSFRRKSTAYLLGALLSALILQVACGGGSSRGTSTTGPQSTSYAIAVTGTSGSIQQSATTTLRVQ